MNEKYKKRNETCEILGIHYHTLYKLARNNEIDTIKIGSQQHYNVEKYLKSKGITKENDKIDICYCRVSSNKQKNDLKNQIAYMRSKYPENKIISDIGSGINTNRKGLMEIIELAIEGRINKLIIAHKDRLMRIGYEMIEKIIKKYSGGSIIILSELEETIEEEIAKDIITIMNVYVAKVNGLRKYKKLIKEEIANNENADM